MVIMTMQSARESPPLLLGPATGRFCSWPVDWAIPLYRVGTQMADGVEVRGNRVRVYFRYEGELCREPFPGEATPDNEAIALAWEDVDLEAGTVKFRRSHVRGHYKVTKTRRSTREVWLLKPALEAMQAQKLLTKDLPPVDIEVTDRDNKTIKRQRVRFVFHKTTTGAAWTSSDVLLKTWWRDHLAARGLRYRGPNNCRHTYASQMLSTGVVPLDWIADQMGHTSTAMIWKHYGKWINEDGPDMVGLLEHALRL